MKVPEDQPGMASRRGLVRVVLITAGLIFVANLLAMDVLFRFGPNLGYRLIGRKWQMLRSLSEPVDYLILGDSSGNQGVNCRQLADRLGGRVLNLGTTAVMLAVNDAWMLEEYLSRFPPPRGVVLVHVYHMWPVAAQASAVARIPLPWGFWRERMPTIDFDRSATAELFVQRYIPLYSQNASLRELLLHPGATRLNLDEHGFMPREQGNANLVEREYHQHLQRVRERPFEISEDNRRAVARIRELAERHGFDVFLVNSPLLDELFEDEHFRAYHRSVEEAIAALIAHSPRVHLLRMEPESTVPRELLDNGVDHVTVAGAVRYTRWLGDRIRQSVQSLADRWPNSDAAR